MSRLRLRLYPASWRERYGAEFEAILAERPLGPFDVLSSFGLGWFVGLDVVWRERRGPVPAIGPS